MAAARLPLLLVALAASVSATWYGHLLLARDNALLTPGYDSAFFQQLVWNLNHGRWFTSSFTEGSFLGLHFEPLLALPAGLEMVWPDPRLLSLLAACSIGAIGVAAFLFLKALTGRPWLAACLAAPLPLWPALQEASRSGFHPEALGLALALLAGWAALRGRTALCWSLALIALGAKEDQAWNLLAVGLALASLPATRQIGFRLAAFAVASGVAIAGVLMPLLRAGHHVDTDSYYGWLGAASPTAVLHAVALPEAWLAVGVLIVGLAGLPLLRPGWLLLAVPPLLADLLSAHNPQPFLHLQYALPLVVPLLVAAGMAGRSLTLPARLLPLLVVPAAFTALVFGSLPPGLAANPGPFTHPAALERFQTCAGRLPPQAPVAADDPLLVRLASRASLREITAARPGDFLAIDREAGLPGYVDAADRRRALDLGNRAILCDEGRFLVAGPAPGTTSQDSITRVVAGT